MDKSHPKLESVLRFLSINGYSVFSLINDILAYHDWEDERIMSFRERMAHDAPDICARLHHIPSGPERVLEFGKAQRMCEILRGPVCSAASTVLSYLHSQE